METGEILVAIQEAAKTVATPNWADKLSIVVSLLAVVVAGFVAWKQNKISKKQADISDKQNKIALFEKRFLVYDKISKIIGIAHTIEKSGESSIEIIHRTISSILEYDVTKDLTKPDGTTVVEVQCTRELVKQASFLFSDIAREDVDSLWNNFQDFFLHLTLEVAKNSTILLNQFAHPSKDKFVSLSKSFDKKYTSLMRKKLDFNEVL